MGAVRVVVFRDYNPAIAKRFTAGRDFWSRRSVRAFEVAHSRANEIMNES
jgi:hypothetical protein